MSYIEDTTLGLTYDSMKKENNSQQIIVFFVCFIRDLNSKFSPNLGLKQISKFLFFWKRFSNPT